MNKIERPVVEFVDLGSYTAAEAARLLRVHPSSLQRWIAGYGYRAKGETRRARPLVAPHFAFGDRTELAFRDLVELKFVKAFVDAGVSTHAVRRCLDHAREIIGDPQPFATRRFRTDGRTIFLQSNDGAGDSVLDLRQRQYVLPAVIEQTFRDLDIEADVVVRWRPHRGKESIVIDPRRAFGQPIAALSGVPTVVLAESVVAEGSIERTARIFEVPVAVIRDAVHFEQSLAA